MYFARTRGHSKLAKRDAATSWSPGQRHTTIERDWLGRRLDLREFHRDPTCRTHRDPRQLCSCHALFRQWDWIVDWIFCCGIVAAIIVMTMTLTMLFTRN